MNNNYNDEQITKDVTERLEAAGVIVPDILLPDAAKCDLRKWSVVACDQFTSQPAYWKNIDKYVGSSPSALRLILPEAYLSDHFGERVAAIRRTMDEYLAAGIFAEPFRGFILTERIFADNPPGARRRWGLIIAVDLEKYDFSPDARTLIRPTEATIRGRLPPRADIRRGAPLELPHAMLLADDRECSLIEPLAAEAAADRRRIIYDFELLAGGGHIRGYAVTGKALQKAAFAVERLLASAESASDAPMLFAVGDGNHSLAAAKMCWDELRARIPEAQQKAHPARYTLVELLNLHSEAAVFEPIHRAVYNISYKDALDEICAYFKDNGVSVTVSEQAAPETAAPSPRAGFAYKIIYGCGKTMALHVEKPKAKLAAAEIQRFIDYLCGKYRTVAIDYIHGADELSRLAREEGCVCLELPPVEKKEFFSFVSQHGIMPNKAFSLGNAKEKRHYLEARRIAP